MAEKITDQLLREAGRIPDSVGYQCPAAEFSIARTSLGDRFGVSSFQRTEPNGRSSIRRIRTGAGPK